jgi:L-asparaginase II
LTSPAPLAEVTRRDQRTGLEIVESSHVGHVVVVGPDDAVAGSVGDPARATFVRSAAKPFQAAVSLEVAGPAAAELSDAEVAVGWASHRGEPCHLDAVRRICERVPLDPEDLTTPPASPEAQPTLEERRLHYNCSGKHALFALAGRALGISGLALLDPDGPLQRRILAELDRSLGGISAVAVDGCGAPAVRSPLDGLARGFRTLWTDDRYARVRDAGLAHPGMVGGEGRLESALLGAGVLAKVGAEGVYAVSWRDARGVWGAAVKSEDGAVRGASAALRDLLVTAGVVASDVWVHPPVLGGGEAQGQVRGSDAVRELGRSLA